MNISLSGEQVKQLAGPGCNVIPYSQLNKYNDINELINHNTPKIALLYETGNNNGQLNGHWCGLALVDDSLQFFDSYGGKNGFPDNEQKIIGDVYLKQSNQTRNKLQRLLKNSQYPKLAYNEHKYQALKQGVNTCGRWVGCFLRSELTTDEFYKFISSYKKINGGSYDNNIIKLSDMYIQN
jgi:hypothetical protein